MIEIFAIQHDQINCISLLVALMESNLTSSNIQLI